MKKTYSRSIYNWFLCFYIFCAILFCIILIPLYFYINNTFISLQEEKIHNQLSAASAQMETIATTTDNILQTISTNRRFRTYKYLSGSINDFAEIQKQICLLTSPIDLIYDAVFQLDSSNEQIISKNYICPSAKVPFYPDLFYVEDLSMDEWMQLLSDYENAFLPIQRIKTKNQTYDCLVYSSGPAFGARLYVTIRKEALQKMLFPDNQEGYYFTLSNSQQEVLCSDLPNSLGDYRTYSTYNVTSNLEIAIHIENAVFQQKMEPLYLYLATYCFVVIVSLICLVFALTRITARPVLSIVRDLDKSSYIQTLCLPVEQEKKSTQMSKSLGFDYISKSILTANAYLEKYQSSLILKDKMLKVHFLTKALNGQLMEPKDFQDFKHHFPEFPKDYRLFFLHLWTYESVEKTVYQEPLLLISTYLEGVLPDVFQLQFNNFELLLVVSESDFKQQKKVLDFLINNINQEEPSYFARCVSTMSFSDLNSLPVAFRQLQDMEKLSYPDEKSRVCVPSDHLQSKQGFYTLSDFLILYTSITCGNQEMAISKLKEYANFLTTTQNPSLKQHMHEMMNTILTCIKLEHPQQLMEILIPPYHTNIDFFDYYESIICSFCDRLNRSEKSEIEVFGEQIVHYIDTHYTDPDLCLTALESHFKCSSSTIYKAFSLVSDVTVAKYITQKRLDHANRLLAQKQKTLNEIALECGFSNVNTFYKAYRRVYGHAPTANPGSIKKE